MPAKMTTGSLRQVLLQSIEDVRTGKMDQAAATAVSKLAAQVNASLLAEVEIMRADIMGKTHGSELGGLPIGDAVPAPALIEHAPQATAAGGAPRQRAFIPGANPPGYDAGDPPPGRSALDQRRVHA